MSMHQKTETVAVKRVTLTLRRKGRGDVMKRLAFRTDETAHDVIEAGREHWNLPATADLRLCKATGFPYESWTKVSDMSARAEVELALVVR